MRWVIASSRQFIRHCGQAQEVEDQRIFRNGAGKFSTLACKRAPKFTHAATSSWLRKMQVDKRQVRNKEMKQNWALTLILPSGLKATPLPARK